MPAKFVVYADSGGKYRWKLEASNGQTIASSGESFASKSNAREAAENVKARAAEAAIAEECAPHRRRVSRDHERGRPGGRVDRVLSGPTNDVWITPWLEHLRSLGVTYRLDHDVQALHADGSRITGVTVASPGGVRHVAADRYVCALPVEQVRMMLGPALRAADPALDRLDHLVTRWMNGIMFYLDTDVRGVPGHTIYIDSEWSLTSISQQQFWDVDSSASSAPEPRQQIGGSLHPIDPRGGRLAPSLYAAALCANRRRNRGHADARGVAHARPADGGSAGRPATAHGCWRRPGDRGVRMSAGPEGSALGPRPQRSASRRWTRPGLHTASPPVGGRVARYALMAISKDVGSGSTRARGPIRTKAPTPSPLRGAQARRVSPLAVAGSRSRPRSEPSRPRPGARPRMWPDSSDSPAPRMSCCVARSSLGSVALTLDPCAEARMGGARMSSSRIRLALAPVVAALVLVIAACGGSDSDGSSGTSSSSSGGGASQETGGKQGGVLRQLGSSDVDYLDPGHTYFTAGYQVAYVTQRPLYSFKPDKLAPVPDLAAAKPEISSDLKTITVKIKPNVKFSPPVNRAVTSKDVKYAFDRFFSANVSGQYPSYFSSLEGAPSAPTKGVKSVAGVTTPDDQTIVFKLSRPEAVSVSAALVMPITMPVPEEYASKFDAKSPSTYNSHVVATGPYMVKNDAHGNLTGYQAGKSIDLVRNPNWDKSTDHRPAYLDEIKLTTNESDASIAAQQVLTGSHMNLDTDPPSAQLRDAVTSKKGQFVQVPSGGYRWLPLNTTIKPLDNVNVRKAILAAFDREAVRRVRGGRFIGDIATHFLPPGIPGFDQAGGLKGPPLDYLANPRGDMNLATEYMKKAGYPSGKYTGNDDLLMVTQNADPGKSQGEVAKAQLEKLGLKVTLRTVPADAMYTEWCQVPPKKVAACGDAAWFKDFLDPQSMLEVTFKGSNITKSAGNNNLAQLDDKQVDAAMDKATGLQGAARLDAWGNIDKMITATAAAVPLVWDKTTLIWSKDVNGVANKYYDTIDFAYTSLK